MVKNIVKVSKPGNKTILYSATQLAKKIIDGEIKCSTVIHDYIERIKEVQPVVNAVAEENFDFAYKESLKIDELLENNKAKSQLYVEKPLLGVPITIKECFAIKGLTNACGVYSRRSFLSEKTAPSVQALVDAGAIVIATSSMPELGLWWETYNTIRGRTKNPYDTRMITGGSSGGEGALIGAGASPLGIGSDVGGSIRMPAFFNGIFGHKPTAGIISNEGHYPPTAGNLDNYLVCGPMARKSIDLLTTMKILTNPFDPSGEHLKLNEKVDPKKLKYYSFCENIMRPWISKISPDLKLAQTQVMKHLEYRLGVKVEMLTLDDLPEFDEAFTLWITALERSGPWFSEIITGYEGKANAITELSKWLFRTKNCHTLPCVTFLIQEAFIKKFVAFRNTDKHMKQLAQLKSKLSSILGSDGVLFFPSNPRFYYRHHHPFLTPLNFVYTAIFNVLGFPVTQCPLGTLSKFLDTTTMFSPFSTSTTGSNSNTSPLTEESETILTKEEKTFDTFSPNHQKFLPIQKNGHDMSLPDTHLDSTEYDQTSKSDKAQIKNGKSSSRSKLALTSSGHGGKSKVGCCPCTGHDKNGLHMPLGIQVVANTHLDRLTLAVAQVLEDEFGGWDPPYDD